MRKFIFLFFVSIAPFFVFSQESDFLNFLKSQSGIQSIEKINGDDFFNESYKIMLKQPIDHTDTSAGFFNQRIFVSNISKDAPVVLITDGYDAIQATRENYVNELSSILEANQIDVEHRYFGESWPENPEWKYLTVANAAADYHMIVELFKNYYSGKWLNTGISKGGQTAISHRTIYPNDVDVTVAYVAPINFGVEDGRHEPFIENMPGTPADRAKIKNMQLEILKRRETLFPMFQHLVDTANYTFRIPLEEVYDYCILEFSFITWQFGPGPEQIPDIKSNDTVLFKYFFTISSPEYFSIEGMESNKSFFVHAAHELGYYGYDTNPFKKYLKIKSAKNYFSKIFLPDGLKVKYKKTAMLETQKFLDTTNKKMMFVYGEYDPWTATGVNIPDKPNLIKYIQPEGNHRSRINNMPEELKEKIINKLEAWMEVSVEVNQ